MAVGAASLVTHWRVFVLAMTVPGTDRAQEIQDVFFASVSALTALVSGLFILRGRNWARWVCAAWLGFHIALSFVHHWSELLIHLAIFIPIFYMLFRATASSYFLRTPQ